MCAADHGDGGEVEAVEGLAGRQAGLDEVALDVSPRAIGEFEFGEGGEQAGGGPALPVGAVGELLPHGGDRGQAQFVQQQRQSGGIDLETVAHAVAPWMARRAS